MTDFHKLLLIIGPGSSRTSYHEYRFAFSKARNYDLLVAFSFQNRFPNMALRTYYNVSSYEAYNELYNDMYMSL